MADARDRGPATDRRARAPRQIPVDRLSPRRARPSAPRPCSAASSPCPSWPRCAPATSRRARPWTSYAPATSCGTCPGSGEPVYRFRHALIQEATYLGLLRAERRRLHGARRVGTRGDGDGRPDEVAAVLARHYAAAEVARALRYYEIAGDHATARSPTTRQSRPSARRWRWRARARTRSGIARQARQRAVAHRATRRGEGGVPGCASRTAGDDGPPRALPDPAGPAGGER